MDDKKTPAPANELMPMGPNSSFKGPPEPSPDGYLYDAILSRVDEVRGLLVFGTQGETHRIACAHVSSFIQGSIGRLRVPTEQVGFSFQIYADQRLRRAPELDQVSDRKWGWRINDRKFHVRAGLLPGRNGLVVPEDTVALSLDLPREFVTYCETRGLTPTVVLRGFIGDSCEIQNQFAHPREDGYFSHGSEERMLARDYVERTFGGSEDPSHQSKTGLKRRGRRKKS